MIEKHPFGDFIPKNAKYFLLGSFTGKILDNSYDWYYGTKRSQFWKIIENVYSLKLENKEAKQKLFTDLNIAISDIILSCERKSNSNLDNNLINIIFNKRVEEIITKNKIKKIFFSSRFVEKLFRKHFKDLMSENSEIELITLPSPSPRYATMNFSEKVKKYQEILPKLV